MLFDPDSTFAVILGASDWRGIDLPSAPSHRRSAAHFLSYLITKRPHGLGLQPDWVLNLFDDLSAASAQLARVDQTLAHLTGELGQTGRTIRDIIVYFVGHGALDQASDLHLLVRSSRLMHETSTGISTQALRSTLRTSAPRQRYTVILDCCFSEAALSTFAGQSAVQDAVATTVANEWGADPRREGRLGTILLCSSPKRDISYGPPQSEFTLFTGAFLRFLRTGRPQLRSDMFSFAQLRDGIHEYMIEDFRSLSERPGSPPRPALHQPEQAEGDLLSLPAFPNVGALQELAASSAPARVNDPMPNAASDNERREIALEALRMLAGADALYKRLLSSLSMGIASVEAAAYLTKGRVKDHAKIVEKVIEKRKTNKNYEVSDVTDIIGLRLLSLYRGDLPLLLHKFLGFVERGRGEPLDLFYGQNLSESIQELIVYGYPEGEALCQQLFSQIRQFGLLRDDKKIRYELKDSGYSSVHIVLRLQPPPGSGREFVPIEVQVRTALEDAWSEIDHALAYKSKFRRPEGANAGLYGNAREQIVHLKQLLDTCGRTADTIKGLISQIFPDDASGSSATAYRSVDDHRLLNLNLPNPLQAQLNAAVEKATKILDGVRGPRNTEAAISAIMELAGACGMLSDVLQQIPPKASSGETIYLVRMEMALCLLRIARYFESESASMSSEQMAGIQNYLRGAKVLSGAMASKKGSVLTATDILDEVAKIYYEISNDEERASDPLVAFRLGEVFAAQRNDEVAVGQFKEALEYLKSDNKLSPDHPLRIEIPRRLGYAYWESAERVRKAQVRTGNPQLQMNRRHANLLDAIAVTNEAYRVASQIVARNGESESLRWELTLAANNLINYAVEFIQLGGNESRLQEVGVSKHDLGAMLERHLAGDIVKVDRPGVADTIRSAAKLLGREAMERDAAVRVLELLKQDWGNRYDKELIADMERDAREALSPARRQH